jgi:hypothetical protein
MQENLARLKDLTEEKFSTTDGEFFTAGVLFNQRWTSIQ